jgi:hypothetical protein
MYSSLFRVVVVLLATGTAMLGQDSVEYGKLPMVPPKLPSATSALASRIGNQNGAPKSPSVVNIPPAEKERAAQPASPQSAVPSGAVASPAAIFILANGDRLESGEYTLTAESVQVVQNGVHRTIPISAVNVPATLAANKQRGIDLKMPANKSQMVLAF